MGEIFALDSRGYEIRSEGITYSLSYYDGEIVLTGDAAYSGTYIQVSNSGANMTSADIWLNISTDSAVDEVGEQKASAPQIPISVMDNQEYILPNSDSVEIAEEQLSDLGKEQLRIARNEIFARHGRRFDSTELQQYFEAKSWYVPRYTAEEFEKIQYDVLSDIERRNIKLIAEMEGE